MAGWNDSALDAFDGTFQSLSRSKWFHSGEFLLAADFGVLGATTSGSESELELELELELEGVDGSLAFLPLPLDEEASLGFLFGILTEED